MTVKDIARLSGYAVGTVSRVLNNQTNVSDAAYEKIMAVVKENNFKLNNNAKYLKQQATSGIAVIVKGMHNILFASVLERIQILMNDNRQPIFTYYIDENDNEIEQAMRAYQERLPQGIIFLGSNPENFRTGFSRITVPCLLLTSSAANWGFDNLSSVSINDFDASRETVNWLISLGHQQIGIIGGEMETSLAARQNGCLEAFADHGLSFDMDRQYSVARFSMSSGYDAMCRLLEKMPKITAVFALSDVQAVGAIRALHDKGLRVPEDISVIGFDGIELSRYVHPKLTTIKQDELQLADLSVEILLRNIQSVGMPVHEWVPHELIEGESVRRISSAREKKPKK